MLRSAGPSPGGSTWKSTALQVPYHEAHWSGLDEHTDTVRYVDYPMDPLGIAPADLKLLTYGNVPWDTYPIG